MRGRRTSRVLIDTTFLLPTLGMEVETRASSAIPLFRRLEIYYMEISILEAAWKFVKLGGDPKIFAVGVEAIRNSYRELLPGPKVYSDAMVIHSMGHRDMIDCLLYSAAREHGLHFLTIDDELVGFLEEKGFDVSGVIGPEDLGRLIGP